MANPADSLNKLIELLHDSRDGYKECRDVVDDNFLKNLFNNLIKVREKMITELQNIVKQFPEEPEKSGSTIAAGHRLFVDLKALLTSGDPKAIVEEIRRGETYTIDHYKGILENDELPENIKDTVHRQLNEIQTNLNMVEWRAEGSTTPAT